MGSCELATTLTGTPHYMSPEALKHQGYDAKSDIWSLACILYEMCCMDHAFAGSSFLSVVLNIVEGNTPSLPERFSRELNTIMECMLNKSPSLRPSAIEVLKIPYIEEHLQHLMCKYSDATLEGKNSVCQKDAVHIISAMQKKIHLQTLQALSEVQKMTPRERMRLRKLQAADEKARKLKKIVEEKYKENSKQMKDSRFQEFEPLGVGVPHELDERTSENLPDPQSLPSLDLDEVESSLDDTIVGLGHYVGEEGKEEDQRGGVGEVSPHCSFGDPGKGDKLGEIGDISKEEDDEITEPPAKKYPHSEIRVRLWFHMAEPSMSCTSKSSGRFLLPPSGIPEDPLVAEEYYTDAFDSCSEESEEQEEKMVFSEAEGEMTDKEAPPAYRTNQQSHVVLFPFSGEETECLGEKYLSYSGTAGRDQRCDSESEWSASGQCLSLLCKAD
ncbi:Serine/threonine-protein kinase Nek11 [Microtus ochrogaster]|uniref:non-specific serine/threonine protein kinase n=1 Tax=Microtus ochrogaster TaxID=79684 RepID=A0A8J6G093_MICOH|nr:Serine/threonine-protein kinase Nek11 [Microtus ochrogaster]